VSEILVLGAGRIGSAMARDLAADPGGRVRVADASETALARFAGSGIEVEVADLSRPESLRALLENADLVVGALPSVFGFRALETVVEARKRYVDVSFFAEDPLVLDEKARQTGAVAVVDAGLAPGLSNLIAGHLVATWQSVERFDCCVGGLPVRREGVWEYAAPFAPSDVLEEYTRPARRREEGKLVVEPALSGRRELDLPEVGVLEAFDTDGLRTLLATLEIPWMREQTLRYPGHAEKVRLLLESGFLSPEPIEVAGQSVRPIDLAAQVLREAWRLHPGDADLAVLHLEAEGRPNGPQEPAEREIWDLYDRNDPATGLSAMARTTGFTCTAVARRVLAGEWDKPGVSAPEHVGADGDCFDKVLADLAARGIHLSHRREPA
jgi:saccharopine dehydrogenase-like NADP-dependent oxidoreductase